MDNDHRLLELAGVWIQAAGTAISAIGNTIILKEKTIIAEEVGTKLVIYGNGLEATGNSFQAIATSKEFENTDGQSLSILGSWFQAGGNMTNVVAGTLSLKGLDREGNELDIIGDSLQSIGALFEAYAETLSKEEFSQLKLTGLSLQSAGALLEAVGVVYVLKGKEEVGEQIETFGSYAQTAGATIAAIATTKQYEYDSKKFHLGD